MSLLPMASDHHDPSVFLPVNDWYHHHIDHVSTLSLLLVLVTFFNNCGIKTSTIASPVIALVALVSPGVACSRVETPTATMMITAVVVTFLVASTGPLVLLFGTAILNRSLLHFFRFVFLRCCS